MTIQSMMDVAAERAYLGGVNQFAGPAFYLRMIPVERYKVMSNEGQLRSDTYQVKMYCVWLLRRLTSAARP